MTAPGTIDNPPEGWVYLEGWVEVGAIMPLHHD
jgi:hypothetical protein